MHLYVILGDTYVTALSKILRRSVRREGEKMVDANQQWFWKRQPLVGEMREKWLVTIAAKSA